jgi:hypothetical protein
MAWIKDPSAKTEQGKGESSTLTEQESLDDSKNKMA